MGTWIKEIPPKMVHDKLGLYKGQWLPEMDRAWVRKEDGVNVYSRLIRTPWGNVEHVTITRGSKGISFDGSEDLTWMEKYQIKNELFGEKRAAVEVYPKGDRLVDTCDVYHLWVFDTESRTIKIYQRNIGETTRSWWKHLKIRVPKPLG